MCCVKILHLIMIHVEGQIDKSIEMCLLGKTLAELTHKRAISNHPKFQLSFWICTVSDKNDTKMMFQKWQSMSKLVLQLMRYEH